MQGNYGYQALGSILGERFGLLREILCFYDSPWLLCGLARLG
jgi:hypothetical protein